MGENDNSAANIVREVSVSNLNPNIQEQVISKLINNDPPREDDAFMDKIFGKKNPQMYVTLLMSIIVLILVSVITVVFKNNLDFVKFIWNLAVPAVTLLWGYAFGKSQGK